MRLDFYTYLQIIKCSLHSYTCILCEFSNILVSSLTNFQLNFFHWITIIQWWDNGTSFPMSIQNMTTPTLYKIWQLVPKCHIMASVHRRLSQSSFPLLELLGPTPKSTFIFFELEEAWFFWPLRPPPLGIWNNNNQMSTPTRNYTSIKHNLNIKIMFSNFK